MKNFVMLFVALSLAAWAAPSQSVAGAAQLPRESQGDYLEVRTVSVFAGACHYSGEYSSEGREAVAAWHFRSGPLQGLSALAVVTSPANLADDAPRVSRVFLDQSATSEQRQALLAEVCHLAQLGRIEQVESAPISFEPYRVQVAGRVDLSIQPMPDDACCSQPEQVWYAPLTALNDRKVGFTVRALCSAGPTPWLRANENSAFYGHF